ncbi:JAB domain-containing protein [Pseudomonas chlororaphis]|uniref:JAB domain-containing protein n=1 Tax=Pseudomonas chlororaphis TaxID=587753 RepID=UPI000472F70E|nr:JAB domain-containing protein [Pseudomonas chlororaphis]
MNVSEATLSAKTTRRLKFKQEQELIQRAITLLERRMFGRGRELKSPKDMRQFLQLKLARHKNEVFAVAFLDAQLRILAFEELFQGSIDTAAVHARVVLQRALHYNAAAVVFSHNHPSGDTDPSQADRTLTHQLKALLAQIDVRVLDHFIIGQGEPLSFAEAGLI